jgi:hypothetical protein
MDSLPMPQMTEGRPNIQSVNYGDILKELQQQQQQPVAAQVPQPAMPAPVPPAQAMPVAMPPVQEVPAPVMMQPPAPQEAYYEDQGVLPEAPYPQDTFFTRYRRHIFLAIVAFGVLQYGQPLLRQLPMIEGNRLASSLATAAAVALAYYVGDVFILSPEVTVIHRA